MGRPPLEPGTAGSITVTALPEGGHVARCRFGDYDGVTRPVERRGKNQQAARANLQKALKDRKRLGGDGEIGPETFVKELAELWFTKIEERVAAGKRSPGTARTYRIYMDSLVIPLMGKLRLRQVTVGRVDALIAAAVKEKGPGAAKTTRAVISGILGIAVRHDVLDANPTREAEVIESPDKKPARALTLDEVALIRGKVRSDKRSAARDLPDLVDMLLATGLRIGEVCAITWDSLNLDARTVEVRGVVIRVKGQGLTIKTYPGSKTKHRTLLLPRWAVAMLLDRQVRQIPNEWNVVFTSPRGFLRDPSNTNADLRDVLDKAAVDDQGMEVFPAMEWVTSHVLGRKTVLTLMNLAGLPASAAADQAGHSKVSMTQDHYFGRKTTDTGAADLLDDLFESK
jgi:integrase